MRNSKAINILTIVGLVGGVSAILFCTQQLPPTVETGLHRSIGSAMAAQTAALVKAGGSVYILTRDTKAFRQPSLDIQLASFQKAINRAKIPIAAVQLIQTDPLRPTETPPGDFLELIRKASADSVIVSFLGPPLLEEQQRRQLNEIKPKIVAFCGGEQPKREELSRLFDQGLLHAAIVDRIPPTVPVGPKKAELTFEQLYLVITAANLSALVPPSPAQI